ncbi:MAG: transposase [Clostridium sp.]
MNIPHCKKDSNGFYVYAKPNLCDTKTVTKYISRHLGRPVIALNRIDSYDGKNVTFHYHRHEDNAFVKKCIPALILFLCSSTRRYDSKTR